MGLPEESQWPKEVTLPWSSFKKTPKQPMDKIIPDLDPTAKDLLEVRTLFLSTQMYQFLRVLCAPVLTNVELY